MSITFGSELKDDLGGRRYWLRTLCENPWEKNENHDDRLREFLHPHNPMVLAQNKFPTKLLQMPIFSAVSSFFLSLVLVSLTKQVQRRVFSF
jgi:hypothetical protein